MSFDNHDRCRRCGTDDTASHSTAECDRILRERAEAQRRHDATHGAARCGHASVCEWMMRAIDEGAPPQQPAYNVRFARVSLVHPDTLRPVTRVQMAIGSQAPTNVRACPACGGNPNEAAPVMR